MHVDLCIQLDEANDMTPETLAEKIFDFQQALGPSTAFSVEVTPVPNGVAFLAELTKRQAEGVTLWAPDPPKDVAG